MRVPTVKRPAMRWSLLTLRGMALLYIARHPGCTKKELAQALQVGQRTVTTVIRELVDASAIKGSDGSGSRLHYEINYSAPVEIREGQRTSLRTLLTRLST